MITFILVTHVMLAITSLGFAGTVIAIAKKKTPERLAQRVKLMWQTALGTVASGVTLIITSHSAIGRSCLTLAGFLAIVLVAHVYQHTFAHEVL